MFLREKHQYPFLIISISSREALIQEKKSVYLEKVVAHIRPTFCCIWKSLLSL